MPNVQYQQVSFTPPDVSRYLEFAKSVNDASGKAMLDAGKSLNDMYTEYKNNQFLRDLTAARDPNDVQSINKFLAQAVNNSKYTGMSSKTRQDIIDSLGDMYTQLDTENLDLAKRRADATNAEVMRAQANGDIDALIAANNASTSLTNEDGTPVRTDALMVGAVDPLRNSEADRAAKAAQAGLSRAQARKIGRELEDADLWADWIEYRNRHATPGQDNTSIAEDYLASRPGLNQRIRNLVTEDVRQNWGGYTGSTPLTSEQQAEQLRQEEIEADLEQFKADSLSGRINTGEAAKRQQQVKAEQINAGLANAVGQNSQQKLDSLATFASQNLDQASNGLFTSDLVQLTGTSSDALSQQSALLGVPVEQVNNITTKADVMNALANKIAGLQGVLPNTNEGREEISGYMAEAQRGYDRLIRQGLNPKEALYVLQQTADNSFWALHSGMWSDNALDGAANTVIRFKKDRQNPDSAAYKLTQASQQASDLQANNQSFQEATASYEQLATTYGVRNRSWDEIKQMKRDGRISAAQYNNLYKAYKKVQSAGNTLRNTHNNINALMTNALNNK